MKFAFLRSTGKILVTGGFDGFQLHPMTEMYDPDNNQWSLVGRLLNPRSGHCMVNFDGHILVLGGFNGIQRMKEGNIVPTVLLSILMKKCT